MHTKSKRKKILFILLFSVYLFNNLSAQCDNRALDFNGNNSDYVSFQNIFPIDNDYTLEFWFDPAATQSNCGQGMLFNFISTLNDYIGMYYCNGDLVMFAANNCLPSTIIQTGVSADWHHLAMSRNNGNTTIFLDCLPIFNTTCSYNIKDKFYLGSFGAVTSGFTFIGRMDEIRFWDYARSAIEIDQAKLCSVPNDAVGLHAYCPADQGEANNPTGNPSNNNTSITLLKDFTGNGHNGTLNNFILTGQKSNFICSNSPMSYPNFSDIKPVFSDYATRNNIVQSICSGDPLHICLQDTNGLPLSYYPNVDTIIWQFNDGSGWTDFTSSIFNDYCFPVPPNIMTIDCNTSTTGFSNRIIRARVDVENTLGDSCWYTTKSCPLDIYCDLNATMQVNTNYISDLLCETDTVDFTVNLLSSYPFLNNPPPHIKLKWGYSNGSGTLNLPAFDDLTSFTYSNVVVQTGQACFVVNVADINSGKHLVLNQCFTVDAMPVCGLIDMIPKPGVLTQLSTSPLVYEICPNEDAQINMTSPFQSCIPTWQYRFNNTLTWQPLGSTNNIQNTNILPSNLWPSGATSIFYRIECAPLNSPSGCDPCYSNEVEVQLNAAPLQPQITGQSFVCFGGSTTLSVSNPSNALTYNWICNGNTVGSGTSFQANTGGCYWVTASDGCTTVSSAKHCIELCEITPIISCPLAPNACPAPGETIYLSACQSSSTCAGNLFYQWSWDSGSVVTINGCNLAHIPLPSGTVYTLIVINLTTGCSATTSRTIVPCP